MINLSDKQSDAWYALEEDDHIRRVLYGGAAGSGKSYLGCVWQIHRRMNYPESVGFIARSVLKTIKESTFITFLRVASEMGYQLNSHYKYNDAYGIIQFENGSKIYLKELKYKPSDPEFTDLGSTEFTDGLFEEFTEITEKAFDILSSRVRYVKNEKHGWSLAPKVLMTCNPSRGWVKQRFISHDDGEAVTLKSDDKVVIATLDDNPDQEFVKVYDEQLQGLSGYDYSRLRYGDWNVKAEPKSPFAVAFDERKQTGYTEYDVNKQVILALDFNIDPFAFTFWHYWRDQSGEHLHCFDEQSIMNASIHSAIDYIQGKYARSIPFMKITGDPAGKARNFSQRDNASLYQQLVRGLKLQSKQLFIPSAPSHINSRADCNYFLYNFPDVLISPKCSNLIFDLKYVEVDAEGSIIKTQRKDEKQKSDMLDGFRYLINTFFKEWILKHQKQNSRPVRSGHSIQN